METKICKICKNEKGINEFRKWRKECKICVNLNKSYSTENKRIIRLSKKIEDLPNEEWRDIPNFECLYQASNMGRIKSLSKIKISPNPKFGTYKTKEILLSQSKDKKGYLNVTVCKLGVNFHTKAHILVAKTFIPNPENKPQVNHKKGIKTDNRVSELEWCTNQENQIHSFLILGRKSNALGNLGVKCKHSKTIIQKNLSGEIIKIWYGANEVQRELKFNSSCIGVACRKNIIRYGFIWEYKSI